MSMNVGVVGLGNMGRHHVRHYANIANLCCLCDANTDTLEQHADAYNCKGYTSFDAFLEHPGLQAISIAAPTSLHYALGKKALEKGIHVLLEKPLAETVEQAQELIELAQSKGLTLTVGHIERFNPAITALKTLIDDGKIGTPITVLARRMSMFPAQIKDMNVVLDLAVHDLDICSMVMGERPSSITGNLGKALIQDRADHAELLLSYGDRSATVHVNWITPTRVRSLSIIGTKGYIELDYMAPSLTYYPSEYTHEKDSFGSEVAHFADSAAEHIDIVPHDALQLELKTFLAACEGTGQLLVTAEDGLHALQDATKILS